MRVIILILIMMVSDALAHGGEDHSVPAATTAAPTLSGSQLKVVSYPGSLEILVKYAPPELDKPVAGRIYFADYASNHPVDPTGIELSFPGNLGAKVTKQPTKVSDGVYAFEAIFVRDTNHTALIKYTYADAEQLASLSPFYAGASATKQLAATGASHEEKKQVFPTWILIPIAIGFAILGIVLFRRRRQRILLVEKNKGTTSVTEAKTTL
jgi:hypothetical protein